jgi:transcriptional regulator with XRE-family HTH domain
MEIDEGGDDQLLRRILGAQVRLLRRRRGLTQAVVAGQVRRSVKWLYNVEAGSVDLRLIDAAMLAHVFGLDLYEFAQGLSVASSRGAGGLQRKEQRPARGEEADMNRRDFLKSASVLGGATMLDPAQVGAALLRRRNLTDHLLDDLEARTRDFARQCWSTSPEVQLPFVQTHLALITRLLESVPPPSQERRLQRLGAEAAALAAWLCFVVEDRVGAEANIEMADHLAAEAGEGGLRAHGLIIRSDLYSGIPHGGLGGMPEVALALLNEAEKVAGSADSPYRRTWLLGCRAENNAVAGVERATRMDLDAMAQTLSEATGPDDGFFAPWNEARAAGFRGSCLLTLGRAREATAALEDAIQKTPCAFTERPAALADLGAAYAQQLDIERACELLSEALRLAHEIGAIYHVDRVRGARRHLARWQGYASVRQLDEQLREGA